MQLKRIFTLFTAMMMILSQSTLALKNVKSSEEILVLKHNASVTLTQKEVLKLLVYTSLISNEVGPIVEVPKHIRKKYNTIAKSVPFSPSILVGGVGATYMGVNSLRKLTSVYDTVTEIFQLMAHFIEASADFSSETLENLIPKWMVDSSEKSYKNTVNFVKVALKPFFTAGVGYAVGFISVAGLVSASSYIATTDADEAMTIDVIRSLLGYDQELQMNINKAVDQLSGIFSLSAEKEAAFKEAIFSKIIEEGMRTDFNSQAMNINILEILSPFISESELKVVNGFTAIYEATNDVTSGPEAISLEDEVNKLLAISAVLETILETKNLTRNQRKEIALRLVNANHTIKQIKRNLK